eukprot:scaffold2752_cov393-Prasinococcus_capsulatus_cf.AAC.9
MVEVIPGVLRAPRGASVSSGDQQGDESERLAATHTSASSQGHHGAGSTRVRLLALYTARALHSAAGRGSAVRLERAIQDAVDSTNQALQRSLTEGPCQVCLVSRPCSHHASAQFLLLPLNAHPLLLHCFVRSLAVCAGGHSAGLLRGAERPAPRLGLRQGQSEDCVPPASHGS